MIATDTLFDQLGRVSQKSIPYFDNASPTLWTTATYDGLSRAIDMETPDGNHVSTVYGGLTKHVYDQKENVKTYEYDAFQRLKRVTDRQWDVTGTTTYDCPLTTQVETYESETECVSTCGQRAICGESEITASGSVYAGSGYTMMTDVTASGNTLSFQARTCTLSGSYTLSCGTPYNAGSITLTGATASGSVSAGSGNTGLSVDISGNTLSFKKTSCSAVQNCDPIWGCFEWYISCGTPTDAGTITLQGVTTAATGSLGLTRLTASGDTITSESTGCSMVSDGYGGYTLSCTTYNAGTVNLVGTYPTCPLAGGSSCSGEPLECSATAACTASRSPGYQSMGVMDYVYDTLGNLKSVMKPRPDQPSQYPTLAITTTMKYDSLDKKREMTDPDMGTWSYTYDKAGNLKTQLDAKSQLITFNYDELSRLEEKVYPSHTVTYTYDTLPAGSTCPSEQPYCAVGLMAYMLDPSSNEDKKDEVLEVDIMQRVTRSKKTIGANPPAAIAKAYDTAGRVTSITYPTNPVKTITYEYYASGNVKNVKDGSRTLVEYLDFTSLLRPQTVKFGNPDSGNGVKTTYTYTPETGRIRTLFTQQYVNGSPSTIHQNISKPDGAPGYEFDEKGNLVTLVDNVNNITHTYTYDDLDRLKTARGNNGTAYDESYNYDPIGNITSKTGVGSYGYYYDSKPHAVRTAGTITLNYDANGNMTHRSDTAGANLVLHWNYDNKPTSIDRNSSPDYVTYTYDGSGQRVRKTGPNGVTLYYGDLYETRSGTETIHIFAGSQRVATFRGSTEQYYHPNHLGSASFVTDTNGNPLQKLEYYPFGTYRYNADPPQNGTFDYSGTVANVNYTFTDQEEDNEVGLYNYDARLYDPQLGRFISADSVVPDPGDSQALNRYSYVLNNPLVYTDPSGNFPWLIAIAAAVISAAITGSQTDWNPQAMLFSAGIAFVTAGVTSGVSDAVGSQLTSVVVRSAPESVVENMWTGEIYAAAGLGAAQAGGAVAGGVAGGAASGGMYAAAYGGNIGQGMLNGAAYGGAIAVAACGVGWGAGRLSEWANTPEADSSEILNPSLRHEALLAPKWVKPDQVSAFDFPVAPLGTVSTGARATAKAGQTAWVAIEQHHILPKYLGGAIKGLTVGLEKWYHQIITNTIRKAFPYGVKYPVGDAVWQGVRDEKLAEIYKTLPLSGP